MTNRSKLQRLPQVITRLRQRAGFETQAAAARAIRRKTGSSFHKAQLSHWERGKAMPTLPVLLTFLEGLGFSLQDFQHELDLAWGLTVERPQPPAARPTAPTPVAEAPKPAAAGDLAARVEELERRLRSLTAGDAGAR